MARTVRFVCVLFALLFAGCGQDPAQTVRHQTIPVSDFGQVTERAPVQFDLPRADTSCTVFYASDDQVALGGNNEDYQHPFTKVWFLPPQEGKYGRVYFGFENFVWQGGMNDQGLFFDALAVDQSVQVARGDKPAYPGSLPDKAMAECATVDWVVQLFDHYHAYDTWRHPLRSVRPRHLLQRRRFLPGQRLSRLKLDARSIGCGGSFPYWPWQRWPCGWLCASEPDNRSGDGKSWPRSARPG